MGFFDKLFGRQESSAADARLQGAVDKVIAGTDPRLKAISGARERLLPAVEHALVYTQGAVERLPPSIELTAEKWAHDALLRAFFTRPATITDTVSGSQDLRNFLQTDDAQAVGTLYGVLAATRVERTVLGSAMEGEILRQGVAQKTVSFNDFRISGFARTESGIRNALEDFVLEQLVMAALRDIASNKQRSDQLRAYRQLLQTRLRLLEQGGSGLDAMLASAPHENADPAHLRSQLAANEAELNELKPAGVGLASYLDPIIEALHNAEAIIQPKRVSLRLNAMNIIVGPNVEDAAEIELAEFSTANPERPRRVGFLVHIPRDSIITRTVDFDALLRAI
ncbi:MAG: hypothetical protein WC023_04185 [Rhodocyclaceae bacterium]